MDMIKVLVAGVNQEEKENITYALANVEYINTTDGADTSEQVLQILDQKHVDVVLVDAYISGNGYKLTESIVEMHPDVAVIIMEGCRAWWVQGSGLSVCVVWSLRWLRCCCW